MKTDAAQANASNTLAPCEPATGGPAWRAAEADGHDMTLIRDSMRISVLERIQQHADALAFAESICGLALRKK